MIVRHEILLREYLRYRHVLKLGHADALTRTAELFFALPENIACIVNQIGELEHEEAAQSV
jgi:hypothetical protein